MTSSMTMRVYEFSKQSGVSAKDLLSALRQGGFTVSSHMSVISQKEIDFLNKHFSLISPNHKPEKATEAKVNNTKMTTQPVPQKNPAAVTPQLTEGDLKQNQSKPVTTQPQGALKESGSFEKKNLDSASSGIARAPLLTVAPMSVGGFAESIKKPASDVIITLLKWGVVAAKNQQLSEEIIIRLAKHYEIEIAQKPKDKAEAEGKGSIEAQEGSFAVRPPVVVVMGHVDHGKTTLLDFIRKTRVAAREKGGITQHLGAYEATTPQGNIVFIDTPGHEAFSKMRTRGIKVADIVVLVIAADDSIMPQTLEALKQAKVMNVPIIVAINKIDKVDSAQVEVVKRDLARYELLPEEWGGNTVVVPLSAKTGKGIDQLLEMIILQSQLMELKASVTEPAKGYVLESKLEKGRGAVATLLCQHGILKTGDFFVCGATHGKVNSLVNSHGSRVTQALPAVPVLVAGFSSLPEAGDYFEVVPQKEYRTMRVLHSDNKPVSSPVTSFFKPEAINILIKTDSNSSKEALLGAIHKLSKKFEKPFNVVYAGIGDVSESDIEFAATTKSSIFTLHVKSEPNALSLAQREWVTIQQYDIIYKLLEDLENIAEGAKPIKMIKTKIGEAVVRQVFAIKGLGVIAGCQVTDGRFSKDGTVVVLRSNRKVGEGRIKSLQRDKKPVKEVHTGFECGFLVEGFDEWQVDDRVECYLQTPEQSKK